MWNIYALVFFFNLFDDDFTEKLTPFNSFSRILSMLYVRTRLLIFLHLIRLTIDLIIELGGRTGDGFVEFQINR
jgi:hypothetical protein